MVGFRADGRTELTKSLREGWWEDVEATDSARTGEQRIARHRAHWRPRALAEAEIQPTDYAGSSAGALVAAAEAYDLSLSEMKRIAARLHRKSIFQIDVLELLRYGGCPVALSLRAELCPAAVIARSTI